MQKENVQMYRYMNKFEKGHVEKFIGLEIADFAQYSFLFNTLKQIFIKNFLVYVKRTND